MPEAELWIVGSHPPPSILELPAVEPRVHVTGYVEHVAPLLGAMSVVLCPWSGTYGFRSRIIEVMAIGVPIVASGEAVKGMAVEDGIHFLSGANAPELAESAIQILESRSLAESLSRRSRSLTEQSYSVDSTYGALLDRLSLIPGFSCAAVG
jgi:glycosyltransferase involved in cell wall biosynthesis